jgi:Tol biopolymer transport system component
MASVMARFVRSWALAGLCLAGVLLLASTGVARSARQAGPHRSWPGKIAYVGDDNNIYVCSAGCGQPHCVTCTGRSEQVRRQDVLPAALVQETVPNPAPVRYDLPTFSPDGERLAYTSTRIGPDGPAFAVSVSDLNKSQNLQLAQEPGAPIYMAWTPDQRRLFVLVSQENDLSLMLQRTDKPAPARLLLTGRPLFFAWNQARGELAINYAPSDKPDEGEVTLVQVTESDQRTVKVLSRHPALFRTPAWAPDGAHLAWMEDNRHGQTVLMVGGADGSSPKPMVGLPPGLVSFVWAPDSRHLAFSASSGEGAMAYDGVGLLDLASGKISTIVDSPVTSYSFSPDGKWLAYVVPTAVGNSWNVVSLDGKQRRLLVNMAVTERQSRSLRYFDQFALSSTQWSPDSTCLTFAGALLPDHPPGQPQPLPPPSIWVLPIDKTPAQGIAGGSEAFWSRATEVSRR